MKFNIWMPSIFCAIAMATANATASDRVFDVANIASGRMMGDFDGNAVLDLQDLELLLDEIQAGSHSFQFDLNGDGFVDLSDRDEWILDLFGTSFGDANLDHSVDAADFNQWNTNRFSVTNDWGSGDFSGDGAVDGSDFIVWNTNTQNDLRPGGATVIAGGPSAVPEFFFVPETGKLTADNVSTLNAIVIDSTQADATVDDLRGVDTWAQAFFSGAEQWVDTNIIDGGIPATFRPVLLANYPPGTDFVDFGMIEWAKFDGSSGFSAVQLPEPKSPGLLAVGAVAVLYRRRHRHLASRF